MECVRKTVIFIKKGVTTRVYVMEPNMTFYFITFVRNNSFIEAISCNTIYIDLMLPDCKMEFHDAIL